MKFGLIMLLFTSLVFATEPTALEKEVAHRLDYLFSDTINEGEFLATVSEATCKESASGVEDVDLVSCQVSVELIHLDTSPVRKCTQRCSVQYKMTGKDIKGLESDEDLQNECLESLTQGC